MAEFPTMLPIDASEQRKADSQQDRVAAEILIRTTIETIANGTPVKDVDGAVQRNLGNVSLADIRAGRLGSNVLGDIVGTVEQAKGSKPFNWSAATPAEIKAYLKNNGFTVADYGRLGMAISGSGRDASLASGERSGGEARLIDVTQHGFAGTDFHAAGLSFDSFNAMRREGFNGTQILSAVNTNKALGIGVNDNPAATARLQRDTPWAVDSLNESHDALKEASSCDEKAKEAEAKGDTAGAERLRKQAETKRHEEAERHRRTQERLGREKPERQGDYNNRYQRMQDGLRGIKSGNEAEDKATLNVIEDYRRHPDDAAARRHYEALNKKFSADPRKRLAMAKIDKAVHQGQIAKAELKANDAKVADNAELKKAGDAGLDILNDTDAPATRAAETSSKEKDRRNSADKPSSKIAEARNTKTQETKKMAQAKSPVLSA
jgi:hypothetical protein